MRNVFAIALVALSLTACGQFKGDNGSNGSPGAPGAPGTPAPTPTPQLTFEGFYAFPDAGYMEIIQDTGSLSDINQVRLSIRNSDNSAALIPIGAVNNLPTQNGKVYYYTSFTYVALTHNIKTDVGNTLLVGSYFTYITMSKVGDVLTVHVQIVNGTVIVFDHSVSSI